ncbi:Six-hairpin glycosidase-like protein [Aspergillus heterothallicus]
MGSISTTPSIRATLAVLEEIFSENVIAKVLRVAEEALENNNPPTAYPEFVPQTGNNAGRYFLREADFWTCGFFPGILYLLRERAVRYPQVFPCAGHCSENAALEKGAASIQEQLSSLCNPWTAPVQAMMTRTDTHDMGFILQPSLRRDWELTGNEESLQAVLTGARSLATRYVPGAQAIRSWDALIQTDVAITSLNEDCVIIIDSMMNLDLLYYASAHLGDSSLADIATIHARTAIRSLLRPEVRSASSPKSSYPLYSSFHVVNIDPRSGKIKQQRTAQGYSTDSTWARGQAWGIMGFAQTYIWTKDREFLTVACGLAEYFLHRLITAPVCVERRVGKDGKTTGRYVPLWDFDAPIEDMANPLRDSSAGVIAANGMLLISQSLRMIGEKEESERFYLSAMRIVTDIIEHCLAQEKAALSIAASGEKKVKVKDVVPGQRFDAILKNATANHNSKEFTQYSDHGLVYADYYLLEFGNQLLRMGLV